MTSPQKHFDKLSAEKQIERLKKLGWESLRFLYLESWLCWSSNSKYPTEGCSSIKDLKALADKLEKEKK